jgi:hypothetical protein
VSLVFVPLASLMAFGGLAVTTAPAGASTSSAAASTGIPNPGPELTALEAQVSASVNDVLNAPIPLLGSVSCIPFDVERVLTGEIVGGGVC